MPKIIYGAAGTDSPGGDVGELEKRVSALEIASKSLAEAAAELAGDVDELSTRKYQALADGTVQEVSA